MAGKDYYDILGVNKKATADEIKKAFRKQARKHHPDAGGSEEKFKELNEAYEVLSDGEKRSQYDQFGQYYGPNMPPGGGAGGPGAGWPGGAGGGASYQNVDLGDLGGLFGDLFSGGGGGGGPRSRGGAHRGSDLQYDMTLDFDQALNGVSTKIDVKRSETCATCKGSGAKPGTSPSTCPTCKGSGHVTEGQGLFGFSRPCPRCAGSGRIIESPCASCKGKGSVVRMKPVTVNVPPGATDGGRLRFKGKGEPGGGGGPAGDLYVVTHVAAHPYFVRDGADIVMDLPVTLAEAALGTEVNIPTPDGQRVKLRVAEGTADGKVYKLPGKGAPKLKGKGNGDLKVKVRLVVPKNLSAEQKELLKRFDSARNDDVREHLA
ncbi:MAG: molecular chaperone DnaJ [Actinomycetota bacterium]|nr:MAG: molecular chaperone [Actinomycetota bacterium]MDO8949894.1 molecular chaperone DnaJ [Actinomycetota bacterium]MDP3630775.1 molecular chaperone DnaJ [Actinomycetota bacterium]